ncbi:MAG: plasmid replication initiator TrfA [Pirellulaceae bacterium]
MLKEERRETQEAEIVPLFGRDEMNLVEFPFGPITPITAKTLVVSHPVWDKTLNREVERKMTITGSDAYGLPRPIDEQVLIGLMALTYEAGYSSPTVHFSRYELCRTLGWNPDGRAYRRIEESLDRMVGTTIKFRDAWWDKGEGCWKSQTFHLIESVSLCTISELEQKRKRLPHREQRLCTFTWNETIWKSFQDGFIKTLDMAMYRRINQGKRKEVAVRLYRVLDKRFYERTSTKMKLEKLCVGKLGLKPSYSPSQMRRIIERAASWLIKCGYLETYRFSIASDGTAAVLFHKGKKKRTCKTRNETVGDLADTNGNSSSAPDDGWIGVVGENRLLELEDLAIAEKFGSDFERKMVRNSRSEGLSIAESGRIRKDYLRKFIEARDVVST